MQLVVKEAAQAMVEKVAPAAAVHVLIGNTKAAGQFGIPAMNTQTALVANAKPNTTVAAMATMETAAAMVPTVGSARVEKSR